MKKAILLSGIFALSVLAGCQTNEKSSKTAEDVKKIEENTEEKGKEDAKKDKKENRTNQRSLISSMYLSHRTARNITQNKTPICTRKCVVLRVCQRLRAK